LVYRKISLRSLSTNIGTSIRQYVTPNAWQAQDIPQECEENAACLVSIFFAANFTNPEQE